MDWGQYLDHARMALCARRTGGALGFCAARSRVRAARGQGGAVWRGAVSGRQAASFTEGASVVLLAAESAVSGDGAWTGFMYDPRREAQGGNAFQLTASGQARARARNVL